MDDFISALLISFGAALFLAALLVLFLLVDKFRRWRWYRRMMREHYMPRDVQQRFQYYVRGYRRGR